MENRYITTTIPYVNGQPHIGHALEFAQVDAIGRYWAQRNGKETVRIQTGSDENSLKNVRAAEAAGEPVADFVARHAEEFKAAATAMGANFDDFVRTREERHMKTAQKLWSACKPEDIYTKEYEGLYCVGCELFYTEKDAENGNCPIHKKELEAVKEHNYFFKLSNYQEQLQQLIESDALKIYPVSRKNEVLAFIEGGLEDFSISRSQERAGHWGVPVPNDDSQVMYVWFDALSNYITGLGYGTDDALFDQFWNKAITTHVLGKDITRFHAVYWPAMLLSAGLQPPNELYVHGFFTIEGEKMSKSLGNVIHPNELVAEYGADATRYYLLREMPYASDGDLSKDRIEIRYAELANQLGNLVSRIAAMSDKYFNGQLDAVDKDWSEYESDLELMMKEYNLKAYIDRVFEVVADANDMVDKKEPFKLVKEDESAAKAVLSEIANMISFIGSALLPIMPTAAEEIVRRYSGDRILKGDPLFPRRD